MFNWFKKILKNEPELVLKEKRKYTEEELYELAHKRYIAKANWYLTSYYNKDDIKRKELDIRYAKANLMDFLERRKAGHADNITKISFDL